MSQRLLSLATILSCLTVAIPRNVLCVSQSLDQINVPNQNTFRLELLAPISTATNKKGDKFNCRVLDPKEFQNATVEGIIARITSGGSAGRTSEIAVQFESITLADGRTESFDAQIIEVFDLVSSNKGQPDREGQVKEKTAEKRVLIIGAYVGSVAGIVPGGELGNGLGVLSVLSQKGRVLELNEGTQISVRKRTREEDFFNRRAPSRAAKSPPRRAHKPLPSRPAASPIRTDASTLVHRYPTMECPSEVSVGQQFALQVSLTKGLITPEVAVESGKTNKDKQLSLSLPDNPIQKSWKMDIVLSASEFLFSKGTNTSTILLDRDSDSSPAIFYLRPKSIQGPPVLSKVYATFWHEGTFLARVFRDITILGPSDKIEAAEYRSAQESTIRSNAAVQSQRDLSTAGGPTGGKSNEGTGSTG